MKRVNSLSGVFNGCHCKNLFSNSSLPCMFDELLCMTLNFNIRLFFCLFVIWGRNKEVLLWYDYDMLMRIPNETVHATIQAIFLIHLWKLPFIFLPKGSSFVRGTSMFSLVAAPWSNQSWTINWTQATANRFSQGTSINFLRCNKLQIEMNKFLLLRRTAFTWCKH